MGVFISYSSKDAEFANRLSMKLIENRIQTWLDKWEMQPGDSLVDKIQAGLAESSFLLVVLSKNSVESEWCKKELNSGLIREIKEKRVVVIPLLVEDCDVPVFLQEKLYADFRADFDAGFAELIRPLSSLFSEHMRRHKTDNVVTDYAFNWGLKDGLFKMSIDLVNWYQKQRKSILLQISALGNRVATDRFLVQLNSGMGWLMKETVVGLLATSSEFRRLNLMIKNDEISNYYFRFEDPKTSVNFEIRIRAVMMGEDDGNNVILNFIDFAEMLDEGRKERMAT